MPPQDEKTLTAVEGAAESTGSYWDEPPEQKLEGKTLSTLNLGGLEPVEKEEVAPKPPSSGGYWDELQQGMKKTLSKLSMSDLIGASRSSTATTSTEESTTTSTGDDKETEENKTKESMTKRPSSGSFWFWRNPSLSDLNNHPEIEEAAKEEDETTNMTNPTSNLVTNRRPSGAGGYWFWRNPSATNLTEGQKTDSEVNLETMAKKAKESDRIEGQQGPISNLQHKMRTSWRASFQKLSTNSLTALTESGAAAAGEQKTGETKASVAEGWKEDFSEKDNATSKKLSGKTMTKRDSFLVEEEGEDAMAF